jgi:D-arabinose 1-dehydrogenase-like Zn-dependent alcohol dehydrogenase
MNIMTQRGKGDLRIHPLTRRKEYPHVHTNPNSQHTSRRIEGNAVSAHPTAQSNPSVRRGDEIHAKAWVAKSAKQPMMMETLDLGPLGIEEVEVAVEHTGLCHSDLSVLNNDWGFSQYPAILGHEVIGRISAIGPNAKGLTVGQRVGVGWTSGSCMHCHQCMSGRHHLCPQVQFTIVGHRGGFATHIRSHWVWTFPIPEAT